MRPCIVIPVYNHRHGIGPVLDQLRPHGLPSSTRITGSPWGRS